MDPELRSAAAPRWRGKAGRLEVAVRHPVLPQTRAGLWIHCETVAPTHGAAYAHGWATWFPADGPPRTERFGPEPVQPAAGATWFDAAGARVSQERLAGRCGSLAWELSWKDTAAPLWTFPRLTWERELLPGAQVVLAPTADFTGSLTVDGTVHHVDGWRGGVAHIYGHGNAKRWGWIHADLSFGGGGGDVLEAVTAVSHRPGLRRLAPLAFIRLRLDGKDWPASPLPSLRMRTTLCSACSTGRTEGRIGGRNVLIRVDQPPDRCEPGIHRPRRGQGGLYQHQQADVHIEIDDRHWSVPGTGHAEVGLRGVDAPVVNERIPS